MKKILINLILFTFLALCINEFVAAESQAQTINPLFVKAQNEYQKLETVAVDPKVKQKLVIQWKSLDAKQKHLWIMAGKVDAAINSAKTPPFLDNYNKQVISWEKELQQFINTIEKIVTEQKAIKSNK